MEEESRRQLEVQKKKELDNLKERQAQTEQVHDQLARAQQETRIRLGPQPQREVERPTERKGQGKGKSYGDGRGKGYTDVRCKGKGKGTPTPARLPTCYKCGQNGHYPKDCPRHEMEKLEKEKRSYQERATVAEQEAARRAM